MSVTTMRILSQKREGRHTVKMTKMTERAIEPVLERSRKRSGKLIAIMNQMSHRITKQRWLAGTGVS